MNSDDLWLSALVRQLEGCGEARVKLRFALELAARQVDVGVVLWFPARGRAQCEVASSQIPVLRAANARSQTAVTAEK